MIGANVTFTNDMYPRSKNKDWTLLKTKVCQGATIGAGSTILPGITIGERAFESCSDISTLKIADGVETIGKPQAIASGITKLQLSSNVGKTNTSATA